MAAAVEALRQHWPEYLMEAWALGMFMISAGVFATLFWHEHQPGTYLCFCSK